MIVETSNQELRGGRTLDYFQNIVETVREPLLLQDLQRYGDERAASRRIFLLGQPCPENKDVEAICRVEQRAAERCRNDAIVLLTNERPGR